MTNSIAIYPNSSSAAILRVIDGRITLAGPLGMVFARILLFAAFQALAALILLIAGFPAPWQEAIAWWPATATATNLACLVLLHRLADREGLKLRDLYNFDRRTVGRDLLLVVALLVSCGGWSVSCHSRSSWAFW